MAPAIQGRSALFAGGVAAIVASTCCLGPLVLLLLGVSGAWISTLTALEPYRPIFIGASLVALFVASRHIFRPPVACTPGEVCAVPQTTYRALFGIVVVLVLIAVSVPFVAPLFY